MGEYFQKTKSSGKRGKAELDLSNHEIKAELKNVTGVDTSKFAQNIHLVNLKSEVDKLDIDKLKNVLSNFRNLKRKVDKLGVDKLVPVPDDLSKLSDIVKNDVLKNTGYNAKIQNIKDTTPSAKINEVRNT